MNENSLLSMAEMPSGEWWDEVGERCIHPQKPTA